MTPDAEEADTPVRTVPPLLPTESDPDHLQACHLDEATKEREAAKIVAMAEVS